MECMIVFLALVLYAFGSAFGAVFPTKGGGRIKRGENDDE